jgi:hypothetical protein
MISEVTLARADAIRQRHHDAQTSIAADGRLSDAAKRSRSAKATLAARHDMAALKDSSTAADAGQRRKLAGSLFGLDGVTDKVFGPSSVEAAMSMRDATDRVSKLENPRDGAHALTAAMTTRDEIMSRAIAGHAYAHRWQDVLQQYVDSHTDSADTAGRLDQLQALDASPISNARQLFAWVLPEPDGLRGRSDHQLQQLANDPALQGGGA